MVTMKMCGEGKGLMKGVDSKRLSVLKERADPLLKPVLQMVLLLCEKPAPENTPR